MNTNAPKMIITIKREAMGDEHPDFSGPGFAQARKMMLMAPGLPGDLSSEDESADPVGDLAPDQSLSPDDHAELKKIAGELRKASELHAGQADRIEEICERMYAADEPDPEPDDAPEKKSYSEERELA
jgi:hypothetical protein|tara:strand:- start:6893 stop:7276 length:384 start_codon:yes stop_codon:yes gene_type:complete